MKSFWAKSEGISFQELARHHLSMKNFQSGSSSTEKPKPKQNRDCYGKGTLYVLYASSLEQPLPVSSDSALGSKLLAQSVALTATTRPTTDLTWTVSMGSVSDCKICRSGTHSTSNFPIIADADAIIRKRNANLRKSRLARGERSIIRVPRYETGTRKDFSLASTAVKASRFRHSTQMTQQSNKGVRSGLPPHPHHCRLSPNSSHRGTARKTKEGGLRKGISWRTLRAFHLTGRSTFYLLPNKCIDCQSRRGFDWPSGLYIAF